ncbi:MAG: radical SAM/SPASM domain-containing protein [Bacteroidales bacterium]
MTRALRDALRNVPAVMRGVRWLRRRAHDRAAARWLRNADGIADRFPRGIVYEATMRCNLRCEFCYVGELLNIEGQWRAELPLDVLERAFPERQGLEISLTGGEIFVRKDIGELLELFRRKGYLCGYLTTNGTLIDEGRASALAALAKVGFLKHVSVSVDGPQDLHDRARGVKGTFERTAAGLRRLRAAAAAAGAPLRVSINTTVSEESLEALDRIVDVAEQLGVAAIGVNHLMFATAGEVAESARLLGTNVGAIATYVTENPGVAAARVREQIEHLTAKCAERGVRFDFRPKVRGDLVEAYYTPGATLEGRCVYPFKHARVGFSGKVYFCPFIRVEVGDLSNASLETIWNSDLYVRLRRTLVEQRIFPVCRRCCKVELEPHAR